VCVNIIIKCFYITVLWDVYTNPVPEESVAPLIFYPEDGSNIFLGKVSTHLSDYTVSHPRRPQSYTIYRRENMELHM
jgi:hypothetical protein